MVKVNLRKNYGIENSRILQFFKDIRYEHIGSNNKSIKVEDEIIPTEVFVRNTQNGRYHLHVAFGVKSSGTENYPQIKVFAHFDINKIIQGKEKHIPDSNEKRNMREMYKIDKKLIKARLGFLEDKDRRCAHGTLYMDNKEKLMEYIKKNNYIRYAKGKYRQRNKGFQYTLALFEQEKFIHVLCVHAKYVGHDQDLIKSKALEEFNRIVQFVK